MQYDRDNQCMVEGSGIGERLQKGRRACALRVVLGYVVIDLTDYQFREWFSVETKSRSELGVIGSRMTRLFRKPL